MSHSCACIVFIQQHNSKAVTHTCDVGRPGFRSLKEVWVIATFTQLHHNVQQLATVCPPSKCGDVLLKEFLVPCLLHFRHANLQDGLLLWGKALLDIILHTTQQEWPQHLHI